LGYFSIQILLFQKTTHLTVLLNEPAKTPVEPAFKERPKPVLAVVKRKNKLEEGWASKG